ncbi:hypothetical protein SAMN05216299_103181 [Nitrosospira sp. Nsp14]|nr:hypothetical protein SAMN05216299_103181 [Nitrosospira sp. Nsp14]
MYRQPLLLAVYARTECGCAYPGFRTPSQDRRAALSLRLAGTGKNITRGYDEQGLARKLCHRPFGGWETVADCERQHGRVCAQVCYGVFEIRHDFALCGGTLPLRLRLTSNRQSSADSACHLIVVACGDCSNSRRSIHCIEMACPAHASHIHRRMSIQHQRFLFLVWHAI